MNFVCNYNPDLVWTKPCPIKKCWAWISPKKHATCCIFQKTQKKTLGVTDLSLFYHQNIPSLKREIKSAYLNLQLGLVLLENLENCVKPSHVCMVCGRPGSLCCNQHKCQARSNFYYQQQRHVLLAEILQVDNWQLYQLFGQKPVQRLLEPWLQKAERNNWLQDYNWMDLFR